MERWRENKTISTLTILTATVLAARVLSKIAFSAVDNAAVRTNVREKAQHACEGCGVENQKTIISHINHARNEYYEDENNLRLYCSGCESIWHLDHIGRAMEIGLTEEKNRTAAFSSFKSLAIECLKASDPFRLGKVYYHMNRKTAFDEMLSFFDTDFYSMIQSIEKKYPNPEILCAIYLQSSFK